jgi:hypothetical protein
MTSGSAQEADQMTMTRRQSPFGELLTLRKAMDRLFDDTLFRSFGGLQNGTDYAKPCQVRIQPVIAGETAKG